jgi:DNA/RNA endonuclease YhcR with UshA esterase domain
MKFRNALVCTIAMAAALASLGYADSAATTQPVLSADKSAALMAANGKDAIVEATVQEIEDASENVMRMTFKEAPDNAFVGIVFSKKTPKVHDYFEGDQGNALIGRKIHLHGKISQFRGKPEIIITDVSQVEVVDAAATQPG